MHDVRNVPSIGAVLGEKVLKAKTVCLVVPTLRLAQHNASIDETDSLGEEEHKRSRKRGLRVSAVLLRLQDAPDLKQGVLQVRGCVDFAEALQQRQHLVVGVLDGQSSQLGQVS